MKPRQSGRNAVLAAGAVGAMTVVALAAGGCGQVSVGDETGPTTSSATSAHSAPDPGPGPDAVSGCADLVDPVRRLVHGEGDTAAASAEVRELSHAVDDNALSTVASRISGLAAQPVVDPVVIDDQWDQFRQICDLP